MEDTWGKDVLTALQDAYLKMLCDYTAVGEYAYRKQCALKQRVPNFALLGSQGIRGYVSVMAEMQCTYFFLMEEIQFCYK
jgi:hypothetical protein